jgi:plastocyanin
MLGARRILPSAALIAMALAPSPAGGAQAADVIVSDNFYMPETLTVQAGSTVLWEQQGNLPHDITADDDSWSSHPACAPFIPGSCMADGDTYSRAFPETGTFGYHCTLHGTPGNGMAGTVRVVEPGFVFPTEVLDLRTSTNGDTLRVLGAASFGGVASLEVGTDPTGDGAMGLPAVFGLDLTKASIGQPDPRTGNLSFMIDTADLPPTGGISELAEYVWDFGLRKDDQTGFFAIIGKHTDAVSGTRVPSFHLQSCDGDGCSEPSDNPVDAVMDGETNRITVTVPRALLEQLSGMDLAGAEIVRGNNYFDGAAARLIVGSGNPGPDLDRVPITGTYPIAEREVHVGIASAGGTPEVDTPAVVAEDGSFEASLDVSGLAPGAYDVSVKACFGTNCATRSVSVTL